MRHFPWLVQPSPIIVLLLFLLGIVAVIFSESFYPGRILVSVVVTVGVGLLFAFIGNMMPKMCSNFFMGIKNPWTLSSVLVWNRTHRLAGWLWFFGGLAIAASALIPSEPIRFGLMLLLLLVITIIPSVTSFVWYRAEKQGDPQE